MILRSSVKKLLKLELGGLYITHYTIPTFIFTLPLETVRKMHSRYG